MTKLKNKRISRYFGMIVKYTQNNKLATYLAVAKKKGYKKLLPTIYVLFLLISFFLALISLVIPKFEICLTMFGSSTCAPVGIYTALISSIPGYLTMGTLLSLFPDLHWLITLLLVLAASFFAYFLIGVFIDKFKFENIYGKTKLLALTIFILLIFFALILLNA